MGGESAAIADPAVHLESGFTDLPTDISGAIRCHSTETAQLSAASRPD
jgi:hypothetical protein